VVSELEMTSNNALTINNYLRLTILGSMKSIETTFAAMVRVSRSRATATTTSKHKMDEGRSAEPRPSPAIFNDCAEKRAGLRAPG
jgi:hypothetical protein